MYDASAGSDAARAPATVKTRRAERDGRVVFDARRSSRQGTPAESLSHLGDFALKLGHGARYDYELSTDSPLPRCVQQGSVAFVLGQAPGSSVGATPATP